MGNQGASNDGPRIMAEWFDAGLIGDVHTSIVGQVDLHEHKEFPGLHRKLKFQKNWIGTYGWERYLKRRHR